VIQPHCDAQTTLPPPPTQRPPTPQGILTSRIVRGLLPPLVCVLLSSYLVCLYEEFWQEGALDTLVPWFPWPNLAVSPEGPFSISTFALSLLLVFRTNSSYDRWWEACTAWNGIVSSVCHLARQTCQWLPTAAPEDERIRAALLRWLNAFPLSLMCYVREEGDKLPALLQGVLLPDEVALMLRSPVAPQTALTMIGSLIGSSRMAIDSKTHMDESVRRLQDAFEACEKIVRTPLPLSYSRHTSRFLVTWLTFLPFCAWSELGWATVPVDGARFCLSGGFTGVWMYVCGWVWMGGWMCGCLEGLHTCHNQTKPNLIKPNLPPSSPPPTPPHPTVILGFFLLGIEEIGVQVEEPLGVLALEHWCGVIEDRITQISEEQAAVQAVQRLVTQLPIPPIVPATAPALARAASPVVSPASSLDDGAADYSGRTEPSSPRPSAMRSR